MSGGKERNRLRWIISYIVAVAMLFTFLFVGCQFGYLMGRAYAKESAYSDDNIEVTVALYEMDYGKKVNEAIFGDDTLYLVLEDGTVAIFVLEEVDKCRFEWVMNG